MGIPSFKVFIHPLLQFLAEHPNGVRIVDTYETVADRVGVSADEKLLSCRAEFSLCTRTGSAGRTIASSELGSLSAHDEESGS